MDGMDGMDGIHIFSNLLEVEDLLLRALFTLPAVIAAYLATKTSRTPQGAMGWIVLILAYPFLGVPAYAIFGYANYAKFAERRRASDARMGEDGIDPKAPPAPSDRLSVFERLASTRAQEGNAMRLLIDGAETFDAVVAAIETAEHYVLVQFYTVEDDEIGRRVQSACIERAKAGVAVYFLHDELPLVGLSSRYLREMREVGIRTARPKGPKRALGPFQWNYRNHRKLVVVDGEIALTGGLNCSETYIGRSKHGPWRDTFCEIRGPVVHQLQHSFAADWHWATAEDDLRPLFRRAAPAGDMRAVALPIAPTDPLNTGNLYFIALAQRARTRLWITTPYFVPDSDVMAALQLAALRGVDLKIIVPDRPDHKIPWWAAFSYFDDLREAGGEIWRYTAAFPHQKVAIVDDDIASIGSVNLDVRSGLLNFELTVIFEDTQAVKDIESMLRTDLENAYRLDTPLSGQPAMRRILARVSRLAAPQL